MIWGMSTATFTAAHVVLSLLVIFVVLGVKAVERFGGVIRLVATESNSRRGAAQSKSLMGRTFVISVLALAPTCIVLGQEQSTSRDQRGSVEQAIRKLDRERIRAQIDADAAALDRIYADDFIGVGPSGTVRTKAQVISDFTSGDLKFQSIVTDEVQIRVYDNTAVETGLSTMSGQDKGKAVPRDTRFTRVWVRQEGRWRLVANHYSSRIAQH